MPREALLEIDVRDIDGPRRDAVVAAIRERAARIAAQRKVGRLSCAWLAERAPLYCGALLFLASAASAAPLAVLPAAARSTDGNPQLVPAARTPGTSSKPPAPLHAAAARL